MKALVPSLKPASKTQAPEIIQIGLDAFGNAIPRNDSLRIVKRQTVRVKPSRKRARVVPAPPASKARAVLTPTLLSKLLPWWLQKAAARQAPAAVQTDTINERLEQAFKRLHHEFNEREQRLEQKMQVLRQEQQTVLTIKRKTQRWLVPVGILASAAMGYMLYIMSSMQTSMLAMSGNINTIAADTNAMSSNTQSMAQNMQAMNASMYYMNHNVAYMSGNVAQMNQKVGTLAQAATPMGEAASTMNPFMKMFKAVMPF